MTSPKKTPFPNFRHHGSDDDDNKTGDGNWNDDGENDEKCPG